MTSMPRVWRGRLALAATVVVWSTPPVFQYWLAGSFDPWTQNFYRYAAGFLAMAPFLWWIARRSPRAVSARDWAGCLLASCPNVLHQIAQTMAVVLLWPGIYALLGRLSVVFTALLAVAFFADERWIARSWKFLAGTLLALVGVGGLVGAPGQGMSGPGVWTGLCLALAAAFGWALYGILVKKFTRQAGPTLGFGMVSFFTALILLPAMLLFGDASAPLRADAWTNFVLFGSGVLAIGLGHWLYYVGIRELGAAPSQAALLICPLGTMLLSAGLFGEAFHPAQIAAGALILGGALLALSARPPVIEEPA